MILNKIARGEVLQSQLLLWIEGIEHFSTARTCSAPAQDVWLPRQVHGTGICVVTQENLAQGFVASENQRVGLDDVRSSENLAQGSVEADAVITRLTGQWIGVRTADCVPVLLADPQAGVVAAVHAGWRGTVAHIVRLTLQKMKTEMGCRPEDIYAMVGPSIGPASFEVGEEVALAFAQAERADCIVREMWGPLGQQSLVKPHVDLWQSNVMDLLDEGLELEHIDCTPWDTYEKYDTFYSARREGIGTGRIVSAIRMNRLKSV